MSTLPMSKSNLCCTRETATVVSGIHNFAGTRETEYREVKCARIVNGISRAYLPIETQNEGTGKHFWNCTHQSLTSRRMAPVGIVSHPGISKRFLPGVRAISSNDFKPGTSIELDGVPWRVLEFLHVKPGKGAAFVRTKLKNYVSGNTVERTFRAGEQVSEATVQKDIKQFSYMDGDQFVFMDMETYEEARLSKNEVGEKIKFLKEGMDCSVLTWNDKVIDIDLPVTVKLKVTQADPGLKGDTAQGGSKLVTVETGAQVTVPLFVSQDDVIVIQTKERHLYK